MQPYTAQLEMIAKLDEKIKNEQFLESQQEIMLKVILTQNKQQVS